MCQVLNKGTLGGLVQDGRVEGCALIFCENTKITTSCWTTIIRRMLEPTKKKDTPRPKTKEKLQWNSRRGAITIKSNPIPIGWAAHKLENNTTKEVLSLFWKFWDPCQASQPRDLAKDLRIPRECDFAGQQDLITRLPQDWGKQSWRAQINYCVHQDPRERGRDPAGGWFRPACWRWRVSCGV